MEVEALAFGSEIGPDEIAGRAEVGTPGGRAGVAESNRPGGTRGAAAGGGAADARVQAVAEKLPLGGLGEAAGEAEVVVR